MQTVGALGIGIQKGMVVCGFSLITVALLFQNLVPIELNPEYVCHIYESRLSKVCLTSFFDFLMIMAIISYIRAIKTDPGYPPSVPRLLYHF